MNCYLNCISTENFTEDERRRAIEVAEAQGRQITGRTGKEICFGCGMPYSDSALNRIQREVGKDIYVHQADDEGLSSSFCVFREKGAEKHGISDRCYDIAVSLNKLRDYNLSQIIDWIAQNRFEEFQGDRSAIKSRLRMGLNKRTGSNEVTENELRMFMGYL